MSDKVSVPKPVPLRVALLLFSLFGMGLSGYHYLQKEEVSSVGDTEMPEIARVCLATQKRNVPIG